MTKRYALTKEEREAIENEIPVSTPVNVIQALVRFDYADPKWKFPKLTSEGCEVRNELKAIKEIGPAGLGALIKARICLVSSVPTLLDARGLVEPSGGFWKPSEFGHGVLSQAEAMGLIKVGKVTGDETDEMEITLGVSVYGAGLIRVAIENQIEQTTEMLEEEKDREERRTLRAALSEYMRIDLALDNAIQIAVGHAVREGEL